MPVQRRTPPAATQPSFDALRRALRPDKTPEEVQALDRARRIVARLRALQAEGVGPPANQRDYWALQTEADLDATIRRTALTLGYFPYHTSFSIKSEAGFPDWVLVSPRRLVIAESKREGDGPRPGHFSKGKARRRWIAGQEEWLARFWYSAPDEGHEVYLWWPSDAHDITTILQTGATSDMACVRRTAAVALIGAETFTPQ
jgi:hypothetical protein